MAKSLHKSVAILALALTVGVIIELDGTDNRKITLGAQQEIKVFGTDAVERLLAPAGIETLYRLYHVRDADFAKDSILIAYGLVDNAQE